MSSMQQAVAAYEARRLEKGVPMEGGTCISDDHTGHGHDQLSNLAALEDANTFFRMDLPVEEVVSLALAGQPTPVSGDALLVYSN